MDYITSYNMYFFFHKEYVIIFKIIKIIDMNIIFYIFIYSLVIYHYDFQIPENLISLHREIPWCL